jgi:D-glycero-alpha-D-manno-heptose-7-phosphate kinase
MIVSSCPLRISLVGGSTDHPKFLEKYEEGYVISFPCNLRVYATVHKDIAGLNALKKRFVINYTEREEVDNVEEIQNDVVRETLKAFEINYPLTISLTSDISSSGSGLASSSAYIMALANALNVLTDENMSEYEVCAIAYNIERQFNPFVGQQDFFGSMSGGLKKINFFKGKLPSIEYLPYSTWADNMMLIHTGISRQSADVLSTIDIDRCLWLKHDVRELYAAINRDDTDKFYEIINRGWQNKKDTSNIICENPKVDALDKALQGHPNVHAHKLCGAGNGGYFLTFGTVNTFGSHLNGVLIPIRVSNEGLKTTRI